MIRSKQPQIDAINRINAVMYMETANRREPDEVVIFDTYIKILEEEIITVQVPVKVGTNEVGGDIVEFQTKTIAKPYFKTLYTREAKYKKSTFYSPKVGAPTPDEYDDAMIAQIHFVNTRDWTGNELQKVCYWDLIDTDLEKVTDEEIAKLLTPFEVTI